MKTFLRVLPVAAAVLMAAACGSKPATVSGDPGHPYSGPVPTSGMPTSGKGIAPGEPDPTGSKGPGGNVPGVVMMVPAKQVDTSKLPNFGKAPQVSVGDGGTTVRIVVAHSTGCATMQGVLRDQNADGVWIALVPMDTPQGGERCAESMRQRPVLVHLDAPLGKRTVYLSSSR